jgi:threonine dehydratase
MIPYEWLEQADSRITPFIQRTPLTYDAARNLYIKWENRQLTGSFKARGAFNKVLLLEDWEREVGLVAASAGNHGQGLALAGQKVGAAVEIFVSEHAVPAKLDAMRTLGAVIHTVPGGYGEAEAAGKAYAEDQQKTWVSPYNDGQVIAGQGTVGLEILRALTPGPSPAGGGGNSPLLLGEGSGVRVLACTGRRWRSVDRHWRCDSAAGSPSTVDRGTGRSFSVHAQSLLSKYAEWYS